MSDTATPKKGGVKGWTEGEKLGLLFQIIEKSGTIPWPDLTLPEGRTQKACQVMVDKEKTKIRKEKAANGGDEGGEAATPTTAKIATPATGKGKVRASNPSSSSALPISAFTGSFDLNAAIGKLADQVILEEQKRQAAKADAGEDGEETPAKKAKTPAKTPRKKKTPVKAEADEEEVEVKAEAELEEGEIDESAANIKGEDDEMVGV